MFKFCETNNVYKTYVIHPLQESSNISGLQFELGKKTNSIVLDHFTV